MSPNTRKLQRGSTAVELAIALPFLVFLMVGAMDFGRAYYHAVTAANAAGTGAFYGAQSNISSGHFDQIRAVAREDAKDIGAVTVTADRSCSCPSGTTVNCISGACAGYGAPRAYVRTRVVQSFPLMVPYPGVPRPDVGRTAFMRVQ